MEIVSSSTEISVSDGGKMPAFISRPKDAVKAPGLIVFQEAFGVNSHIRDMTKRFAKLGFFAVAPELFHRTAKGFQGNYGDFQAVTPHISKVSEQTLRLDSKATYDWLTSQSLVDGKKIACTGYCLGGRASFVANASVPLQAAISYYGGRIAPDLLHLAEMQQAPILFFWGGQDKHIPPEQIRSVMDALRTAQKPHVNVEISFADHGFSCDERPAYNEKATREAWAMTVAFLENNLGIPLTK